MNKRELFTTKFYRNPIALFAGLTVLFAIVVYVNTGFHIPDYYVNRHMLEEIRNMLDSVDSNFLYIEPGYINLKYDFQNLLFQIFTWSLSFLIFTSAMKITSWQDFKTLPVITNKKFIYLWLNLGALLIIILKMNLNFNLCTTLVRPMFDHSTGYCCIFVVTAWTLFAIVYCLIANTLFFLVYNKNIRSSIIRALFYLGIAFVLFNTAILNSGNYSPSYLLFELSDIIWIYLLLSAIKISE